MGGLDGDDDDDNDEDEEVGEFYVGDGELGGFVERSGKLQILAKILPLWKKQGHRVLIFSQTKQALNLIEKFVREKGMVYRRMDGSTSIAARQGMVDR